MTERYVIRQVPKVEMPKYAVTDTETGEDEGWFFDINKARKYEEWRNSKIPVDKESGSCEK